jgi:hypothetical protein
MLRINPLLIGHQCIKINFFGVPACRGPLNSAAACSMSAPATIPQPARFRFPALFSQLNPILSKGKECECSKAAETALGC